MDLALVVIAPLSDDGRELEHAASARQALSDAHVVETIDLLSEQVAPAMSRTERLHYMTTEPIVDPVIEGHAALVARAAVMVFVFPTAWWTPPAVVQAWIERTFVPGVAFRLDDRNRVKPNLSSLRAIVGITTQSRPGVLADGGDGARRIILRTIRLNAPRRVRTDWLVDPDDHAIRRSLERL